MSAKYRHLLKRWGIGVFLPLFLLMSFSVIIFYPKQATIDIPGFTLAIFFAILFPAYFISGSYLRKMKLNADRIAVEFVTRDSLIQVLKKIQRLGFDDIAELESLTSLWTRGKISPTISERIQNLSSVP